MCVNNLSKVALDSAAAGIEPAISSRKSNALTTIRYRATLEVTYENFEKREWFFLDLR